MILKMTKYIIEGLFQNFIFYLQKKCKFYTQTFLEIYTIKFNKGYLWVAVGKVFYL